MKPDNSVLRVLLLFLFWLPAAASAFSAELADAKLPAPTAGRVTVLVVYHSRSGHTEKMAQGVVEGARRVEGVEVVLRKIEDVTKADLESARGLVLGCPTYFANIPGKMKASMDEWNWKLKVDFTDKVGGAFSTGGGQAGGKEHVITSMLLFMLSNRMIVAGPLYEDPRDNDIWGEPGSAAMTGPLDPGVGDHELDAARRLGERIARLSKKLK